MLTLKEREDGFTLVEILATVVILSFVFLATVAFFSQSLSYTKKNEQKTVSVHLARNALVYLEKQLFIEVKQQLSASSSITCNLNDTECSFRGMPSLDKTVLKQVLNPVVNGVHYSVVVRYQNQLYQNLDTKVQPYLLPVEVEVFQVNQDNSLTSMTRLEGYITHASIR